MEDLVSARELVPSTLRSYQIRIRAFCDYATSPDYDWSRTCLEMFGAEPRQIADAETCRRHLQDYEGTTERLVLTREEVELFFAHADAKVGEIVASGRKGALAAYRFSAAAKITYAWGLRANEVAKLDVMDFYRNPRQPQYGDRGMLLVRHGKSSRGQPPKRRSVATYFPWAPAVVDDYIDNIWSKAPRKVAEALWVTERGTRLAPRDLSDRFKSYREELGLPRSLTFHSLRRSYATHLFEADVDVEFIRRQLGHKYLTTTLGYIHASEAAANRLMDAALRSINEEYGRRVSP